MIIFRLHQCFFPSYLGLWDIMGHATHLWSPFSPPKLATSRASERTPWNLLLRARKSDGAPVTGARCTTVDVAGAGILRRDALHNVTRWIRPPLTATIESNSQIYLQGLLMKAQERETAAIWRDTPSQLKVSCHKMVSCKTLDFLDQSNRSKFQTSLL